MKYRTKLILIFSGVVIGTVLLGQGLTYLETRRRFVGDLKSKVLGVATTASKLLDRDQVAHVSNELDANTDAYVSIIKKLREVRDANRRSDLHVRYIYLIRPDPENPNQMVVVADATEDPSVFAPPGTKYPEAAKIGILNHLNEPFAPQEMIMDRWGTFLPGYAPIVDKDGRYLATIGVNLSDHYVNQELDRLKWIDFWTTSISLLAGLIVAIILANGITRKLRVIFSGVSKIGHGELDTRIDVYSKDELGDLALEINDMAKGLEERDRLKQNFIRYVSKHVMEKILASGKMPVMEGERRKITVLFSDIRGFTRLSERLPPEEVVSLLNEYLAIMLDVIFAHSGTLDKFIGDGLMVEFGAPLDDPEQELHAVQTALAMNQALVSLNQKWLSAGRPQIVIGIGIHTGLAVVGNIGSEKRLEYTAIGDTVNVASRLQEATKELHTPILVSETTWAAVEKSVASKELGSIHLKGRDEPIKVYAIVL